MQRLRSTGSVRGTREITRVGTWSRHDAVWNRHSLAVDRDGQVLLVAGSSLNQRTKVARLRLDGNGNVYASQIHHEGLPYTTDPILVDKDEFGFMVRDGSRGVTSIYRRANLVGAAGGFSLAGLF